MFGDALLFCGSGLEMSVAGWENILSEPNFLDVSKRLEHMRERNARPGEELRTTATSHRAFLYRFNFLLLTISCSLAGLTGCFDFHGEIASPPLPPIKVFPVSGSPIEHIVVIMQENRTFDNLFNGFPGADTVSRGVSNGVEIPLNPVSLADPRDLHHSHLRWWQDWNQGKMDGFAQRDADPPTLPYSYVPKSELEPYWTMATQYTLGDRMFQPNTGPSFVAHQYMIAGQSGNAAENPSGVIWGCDAPSDTRVALIGPNGTDLAGVYPCFEYPTIADILDAKQISWRYYAPASADKAFVLSAFQAIHHIRFGDDWRRNVISPQTRILADINHGQLAQVTWIVPDFTHSDHPGTGSNEGPDWVASIVNAIGGSQFWRSTAIFITWDDWGGWYDHVNPPTIDNMGLGFRVPLVVVSPYARHGYVSHQVHEASGFITFIEKNFGLQNLGTRDVMADAFSDCFDYRQKPSPFRTIGSKVGVERLLNEKPTGPPDDD